ncbi:MAG: hypothetical protein L3I91_02770 [Mycoplasma sp.]
MKTKLKVYFKWFLLGCLFTTISTALSINCKSSNTHNLSSFYDHPYESLESKYRDLYYFDINREEINLQKQIEAANKNSGLPWTERFSNVYYHDDTWVDVYRLNTNDNGIAKCTRTLWQSQNGFAHIAENDNDPHVNTWEQVFAYNDDVAAYFSGGVNHIHDKCTKSSIAEFITKRMKDHTINLSGLFVNDMDRDNSVISLLNPSLMEYLIAPSLQSSEYKIDTINLSNNLLRAVPNWASIANKTQVSNDLDPSESEKSANWFFNDSSLVGNYRMSDGREKTSMNRNDGYFEGINLTHNQLSYLNLRAYNEFLNPKNDKWISSRQSPKHIVYNDPNSEQGIEVSVDKIKSTNPGLPTLVKFFYKNQDYYKGFLPVFTTIQKRLNDGLMIDYNYLPRLLWFADKNNKQYIWWEEQLNTYKWDKQIAYDLGLLIPARYSTIMGYLNYNIANASNEIANDAERVILRWGVLQKDQTIFDLRGLENFIKQENPTWKDKYPSEIFNDHLHRFLKSIDDYSIISQFMSLPLESQMITPGSFVFASLAGRVAKDFYTRANRIINDSFGYIEGIVQWPMHIDRYFPENFNLDKFDNYNKLISELTSYFSIAKTEIIQVFGFKANYFNQKILAIVFGSLGLFILSWLAYLIYANTKHRIELKKALMRKAKK